MKRNHVLLLVVIWFILFNTSTEGNPKAHLFFVESTEHAPIYIDSVDDFITLGFPGNGSEDNPYCISGLTITTSSGPCIAVWNVSAHYVISDCIVTGPIYATYGLIAIGGDGYGTISRCNISNSAIGINLDSCTNTIEITDNTFSNLSYIAILCRQSNVSITGNNFLLEYYSSNGVLVDDCKSCTLVDNRFDISGHIFASIHLNATESVNVKSCSFYGYNLGAVGIYMHYYNVTELVVENSLFVDVGSNVGFHAFLKDIIIRNCTFTRAGISTGEFITGKIEITGNTYTNSTFGPYIRSMGQSIIKENVISECNQAGIMLGSNNSLVSDNRITNCLRGIRVLGHNNTIRNNTIRSNSVGISLDGDMNRVYYNSFLENEEDAEDYGNNNIWDDDVSMGNYWDTPSSDGIHPISGPAGSVDRYPIYIETMSTTQESTSTLEESTTSIENTAVPDSSNILTSVIFIFIIPMIVVVAIGIGVIVFRKRV